MSPYFVDRIIGSFGRQKSNASTAESVPENAINSESSSIENEEVITESTTEISQDEVSSDALIDAGNRRTKRKTAPHSTSELLNETHRRQLFKAHQKVQMLQKENQEFMETINYLRTQLCNASATNQQLYTSYMDLKHYYDELAQKNESITKNYEDLDKKYMAFVRTLQVTGHDRSTINNQLTVLRSSIEYLVIKGRGKRSMYLNRDAAIQHFRNSGLLQYFPIKEQHLESFHLNLFMECAIMTVLLDRILLRPLECIFDHANEFEMINRWVEHRGSNVAARWRQELCILIAQESKDMADRKKQEVNAAMAEIKNLISSVYREVDAFMSAKIEEICNLAFDLSFAMLGMESRVYPVPVDVSTPFNGDEMTLAMGSNPSGPVSLLVFPKFQDTDNRLYYKAKVFCA
ncbi:hypothetical protein BGW41_002960 [Actinomortierella wolfii]|nr:hypothetical protein BGW41_002960 [Actinomortierella wolfii]